MKKETRSTGLWRGLTAIFAAFLALVVGAQSIAQANASFINGQLGITNYKIVETAGGEAKDSTYYKSEFSSLKELVEAKNALARLGSRDRFGGHSPYEERECCPAG